MFIRKIIFLLILSCSVLSAGSIKLSSLNEPTNILNQTQVYVDAQNKYDFKYILKNQDTLFKANEKDLIHLGYSPDALWLKFSIKNDTNQTLTKVLEISNQMLDNIVLFTKEGDEFKEEQKGVLHKITFDEKILKFHFDLSLKPQETKEYFLHLSSISCAVYFELNMLSKDQLYQREISHQLILTLFFGSIATLILYNLFVYFFTRDLAYLFYVLYLFFTMWEHISYSGMGLYILSMDFIEIDAFLAIYYLSFISIFALLFTREFLNIKRYKKLNLIIKILVVVFVLILVFASQTFYPINLVVFVMLFSLFYVIALGFYLLYKGEKNAKYLIVGWSIAVFGWIMLANFSYGYWTLISTYPYFFELTIFIEAILFSVALANKLNTTKELERSVQTNEVLTRELHHRVKNNMQFIISMYRLKLAKFSNRDIADSLKEVEGTIQAMSATHEMLYAQKAVSDIDTKEYFSTLVQRLKESFNTSKIKITLEINTTIDIDTSIYVGIILNELITNSFKYAFKEAQGEINISLSKPNNSYELIVADNGVGFDAQKESETFGIELVKTLVQDELKGKLELNADNGCSYKIGWS